MFTALKLSPAQVEEARARYLSGETCAAISLDFGVSKQTIGNYLTRAGVTLRPKNSPCYNTPSKLSDADRAEFCSLYLSGSTVKSIAQRFNVDDNTVRKYLVRAGVEIRKDKKPFLLSDEQKSEVCALYAKGESTGAIADLLGLWQSGVSLFLKEQGIERRPNRTPRRYEIDHNFFGAIDTEAKAYTLGFLAADGCISGSNVRIMLQHRDAPHLEVLAQLMGSNHPVATSTVTSNGIENRRASWRANSPQMVEDLALHGITPRKTFTVPWPRHLSDEMLRHYLRGAFDGDGWWSLQHSRSAGGGSALCFGVMGNWAWVEGCRSFLSSACCLNDVRIYDKGSSMGDRKIGRLCYGGRQQSARIAQFLYDGATVYLDRKYKKARPHF